MIPERAEARRLVAEAEECNPGPWGDHSRTAAECAEKIAAQCTGMDPEKAYVLGLLHDIGRKFGTRHLGHVYDGWKYMLKLGYDEAAKICLTHSFCEKSIENYIGKHDIKKEEEAELLAALESTTYDDYDLLIQLCDSIAGAGGVMRIEDRMEDVKQRYGSYPQDKWDRNLEIKKIFEEKMGMSIDEALTKPSI